MKTIDFTKPCWGHNLEIETKDDELLRGFCWATPGPQVGDLIVWETNYGQAVGAIIECEWVVNVDDMYKITVDVVERKVNEDLA